MHPPIILTNSNLPRLFCKPEDPNAVIHYSDLAQMDRIFSFRSLDLEKDMPIIHRWVNMPYTAQFWQMDGAFAPLLSVYEKILQHPNAHSFVGFYGDELICQLDVYMVGVDELTYQMPEASQHCGFHLLMAPIQKRIQGLTLGIIQAFLEYYFSFPQAQRMYAEPDVRNQKSIQLLKDSGFEFQRSITLSYKSAHLYCLSRKSFFSHASPASKPSGIKPADTKTRIQ